MSIEILGPGGLDYLPCRYGASKLVFRGPRRDLKSPYVAFVGGTETYGKFIETPFPGLVEDALGLTCANFGIVNAGIDVFAKDPFVMDAACEAQVTVVQVMGAQNMSNRFYSVHPRRNDRFVAASQLLQTIYREVDFSEFNFNKHMLGDLLTLSPERFETVRSELQQAWVARMGLLLGHLKGKVILLWFASEPPANNTSGGIDDLGCDPLFVTREMLDKVAPLADQLVEVCASPQAMDAGSEGMVFSQMETLAANEMLGPIAHSEAAAALGLALNDMM